MTRIPTTPVALIGLLALGLDLAIFLVLRLTVLEQQPIAARATALAVAATTAWLGLEVQRTLATHRSLTSPTSAAAPAGAPRAAAHALALTSGLALLTTAAALVLVHHVLGLDSVHVEAVVVTAVGLGGLALVVVASRPVVLPPARAPRAAAR